MSEAQLHPRRDGDDERGGTTHGRSTTPTTATRRSASPSTTTSATCETGNANFGSTTRTAPPRRTRTAPATAIRLPGPDDHGLAVSRKVFVPDNDGFARWLDIVTNTGGSPASDARIANNLGSDTNTVITATPRGTRRRPPRTRGRRRSRTTRARTHATRASVMSFSGAGARGLAGMTSRTATTTRSGTTRSPRARPDPDPHELRRRPAGQGGARLQVGPAGPAQTPTSSTA